MGTIINEVKIEQILSAEKLKKCSGIFIEAYSGEPWNENGWTDDVAKELLAYHFDTPVFLGWIATLDDQIIGCCIGNIEPYYTGKRFVLKEIFVSAMAQKVGVGIKLLEAMKISMATLEIKTILLFTHRTIFGFYNKAGFSELQEMGIMMYENN